MKRNTLPQTPLMNRHEYSIMYKTEQDHWWYKGLRNILLYWIDKLQPSIILDAGCGTGINLLHVQKKYTNSYGIDASADAVKFSKQRNLKRVKKGKIQSLPFKASTFDLIYSTDVLGILSEKDSQKAITEFKQCLKKKGHLILHVAAMPWLYSQHDIAVNLRHRYTKKDLVDLLQRNNFTVIKATYRIFFLFVPIALVKLLEKKQSLQNQKEDVRGDLEKTNRVFNIIFSWIMYAENRLTQMVDLPIGSSLFIVAQKK